MWVINRVSGFADVFYNLGFVGFSVNDLSAVFFKSVKWLSSCWPYILVTVLRACFILHGLEDATGVIV